MSIGSDLLISQSGSSQAQARERHIFRTLDAQALLELQHAHVNLQQADVNAIGPDLAARATQTRSPAATPGGPAAAARGAARWSAPRGPREPAAPATRHPAPRWPPYRSTVWPGAGPAISNHAHINRVSIHLSSQKNSTFLPQHATAAAALSQHRQVQAVEGFLRQQSRVCFLLRLRPPLPQPATRLSFHSLNGASSVKAPHAQHRQPPARSVSKLGVTQSNSCTCLPQCATRALSFGPAGFRGFGKPTCGSPAPYWCM